MAPIARSLQGRRALDRFIVGTGRCGSTLLSRMLARSPAIASVFELFNGLDVTRRFHPEPVPGTEFADLISREQPFLTAVLKRGFDLPEVAYPFGRGRYRRGDPLPWILVGVLPRLFDDPDAVFDEVVEWGAGLLRQPLVDHYRQLFDWLVEHAGREVWIERSGSSVEYLGSLHELFPRARFVHLDAEAVIVNPGNFDPGHDPSLP